MSFTGDLLRAGGNFAIPFSDKIPGIANDKSPKISKKEEKRRLKTAKAMEKAIENGTLDSSYSIPAKNMKARALKNLSEADFSKKGYIPAQLSKAAPLLDMVIPGSGIMATNAARVGNAQNIYQYGRNAPSIKDTAMKVAGFAAPFVFAAAAPMIKEAVAPYITTATILTGVASVFGTTLFLDAVSYLRNRT